MHQHTAARMVAITLTSLAWLDPTAAHAWSCAWGAELVQPAPAGSEVPREPNLVVWTSLPQDTAVAVVLQAPEAGDQRIQS